jgi:hypothetical protein
MTKTKDLGHKSEEIGEEAEKVPNNVEDSTDFSRYEELQGANIVNQAALLLQAGWQVELDGKIRFPFGPAMTVGSPWIHIKQAEWAKCNLWHQILFDKIFPQIKKPGWVPIECQSCWKVVVRPTTLQQLYQLLFLQKALKLPSKCGIERRDSVCGSYGGYFYNHSIHEGLECLNLVRENVTKNIVNGGDIEVFLKRGCTEFEHRAGDSRLWSYTEEQAAVETLVMANVEYEIEKTLQPESIQIDVEQRWIEFAFERGDTTYKLFTKGKPIFPDYVKYNKLLSLYMSNGKTLTENEYIALL